MPTRKENRGAYLAALLVHHYPASDPYQVSGAVAVMQMATHASKAWELKCCNDRMTEKREAAGEARIARLQGQVNGLLADAGCSVNNPIACGKATVRLGGDCRGPCGVLIILGSGGEGWHRDIDGFSIY